MKRSIPVITIFLFCLIQANAQQVPDSCKLKMGTNLNGICDWCTEMPFVDVMKQARQWMTSNEVWVSGGQNEWDTGLIDSVPKDQNGYPLYLPFFVAHAETLQVAKTIWADCSGWPEGTYTVLYDGTGQLDFAGNVNVINSAPGRYEVDYQHPSGGTGQVIMTIMQSDTNDHLRNIRFLMPGTEQNYQEDPYYKIWKKRLEPFSALRFMDWGHTNNFGYENFWTDFDSTQQDWSSWNERAKMHNYTWATPRGVPYEMMIRTCNELQKDMWICVPHNADSTYIANMAKLVRDSLDPELTVYVEYSNEVWNWIFGQTQWLYTFGCVQQGVSWPEGTVPYIQNMLDIWTSVFRSEMHRLERVIGVQTGWLDVSKRICFNLDPNSFDLVSPTYYFGLSGRSDSILDQLGNSATAQDIAKLVKQDRQGDYQYIKQIIEQIAEPLGKKIAYYEGGQHITPHPFGQQPTYAQALLDIQRDTAMYQLYVSWFDSLRSFVSANEPHLLMNFSFVGRRSAQYGSWGILEKIDQDTAQIPAPKYRAVLDQIHTGCWDTNITSFETKATITSTDVLLFPNPVTNEAFFIQGKSRFERLTIYDLNGKAVYTRQNLDKNTRILLHNWPRGIYFVKLLTQDQIPTVHKLVVE